MTQLETKSSIKTGIEAFDKGNLTNNALALFKTLGYNVDRRQPFKEKTFEYFKEYFLNGNGHFREDKALVSQWTYLDLLFQLSKDEISQQHSLFDTRQVDRTIIETYLFFAIGLKEVSYSRTIISQITRELNRVFPMPVMALFKHGSTLTLSIINRRLHKRDEQKDVLEKVTLIKDISIERPHRAHIEILFDLSFDELLRVHKFNNFVELHNAWQKTLDIKELNKRFYQELSNWYFWAMDHVSFPDDGEKDRDIRNSTNLIRLITRIIFNWFIKEKSLVPEALFDRRVLKSIVKDFLRDKTSNNYYKAILQNLFFGTLNQAMNERGFAKEGSFAENRSYYGAKNLFHYADLFTVSEAEALNLFKDIPFLNGGLFDCLDKENEEGKVLYTDGFSRNSRKQANVPDFLFFGSEEDYDLNQVYGTKNKRYAVQGLIEFLSHYKFTIAENTPIEEEVALDPELLGKVFENLLASYNPETKTTARKQTGSFYTPREVVQYMVDESLKAYLEGALIKEALMSEDDAQAGLDLLLEYTEKEHLFNEVETRVLINAIDKLKMLDPACGSGAFPMGVLHKLVHILHKLDPNNEQWKQRQIDKVYKLVEKAQDIPDSVIRGQVITSLEQSKQEIWDAFESNELDYGRKLYLIENCLYGVDIQPIAVQIAKLRFFISLIIDQKKEPNKENFGIRALPNLETKFVAANTLIGLDKPLQMMIKNPEITKLENDLKQSRHRYFSARTRSEKLDCQKKDEAIRTSMRDLLIKDGWGSVIAEQIVRFDPYDQNTGGPFFDPEWMFGIKDGFDVVIGNPPYVRQEGIKEIKPMLSKEFGKFYCGTADLYTYFYKRGIDLLRPDGHLCFIAPNKFMRAGYGKNTRELLAQKVTPRIIIDFCDLPIFDATTYPSIVLIEKRQPGEEETTLAATFTDAGQLEQIEEILDTVGFSIPLLSLRNEGWTLERPEVLRLMEKLKAAGKPLGEYVNGRFYYGIKTGFNEAFVIDEATRQRLISEDVKSAELIKPWLRGKDIKKWKAQWAGLYLITIPSSANKKWPWTDSKTDRQARSVFQQSYPAIHSHLSRWEIELRKRDDQGKFWWELRSCAYYEEFAGPKIIYPDIAKASEFTYDTNGAFLGNTAYIIPTDDVSLVGFFNSRLMWWYYRNLSSMISGGFVRFIAQYMGQLPIVLDMGTLKNDIAERVRTILSSPDATFVPDLEADIDRLIYNLYDLTSEEIAIIEVNG